VHARDRVAALLAGLGAGIAGGLLGVGGGIVLIPLLTARFRLGQHAAHGTSLAVIGATALSSLVIYGSHASVAWMTALWVALASILTVRLGSRLARRLSSLALTRVFAIFLVVVAARLLWKPAGGVVTLPAASTIPVELGVGSMVGLLAGLMGVGGGILAVPAFTLLLGMSQRVAQGTSLAVILVTAPVGTIDNSRHGQVAWALVPMLAVGAAIGGPLASWFAHLVPQDALARIFAIFLLASAILSWIRSGRARLPVEPVRPV
jgi:uncharacterized membrane protein YfcA